MKLADQVGATVRPGQYGTLDVVVGGMSLVSGSNANKLAVAGPVDPDLITATDKPRIVTASGNYNVVAGGTAGGQLSTLNTIIPGYRAQLNGIAKGLADAVNAAHKTGFDRAGLPGGDVFGSSTTGPITADSIKVLLTDPALIAASSVGPTGGIAALDNGNADKIAQLRQDVNATYRKMIVELGVQAAVAIRNQDIQAVISTQVDAARESVAGVNIDEEMTNMLSFQHAYSAAGRMVTAIDQTLDTLINRTGLVGR
jgi:flagellar hook-associated protein 1 FlgK